MEQEKEVLFVLFRHRVWVEKSDRLGNRVNERASDCVHDGVGEWGRTKGLGFEVRVNVGEALA